MTKLVYLDNLYGFGEEAVRKGPLTGSTPHQPSGKKAKLRSSINNQFMETHDQGRFKITIGDASDLYGPGCRSSILDIFVFNNVAKGKGVRMLADKTKKHSFAYGENHRRSAFFCQLDNEQHPATDSAYECTSCKRRICSRCFEESQVKGLTFCAYCNGELTKIQ